MIYRREEFIEESETDQKYPVRQIEQLTSLDGSVKKFLGRVSLALQTPMGMTTIPVQFEIEAATLAEAFGKFPARADEEIEISKRELQEEMQEMRRRQHSRIVTSSAMPPEPGKIKLP